MSLRALLPLFLVSTVHAQYTSDPAVNLSVADGAGDQVQAKVAAGPSGDVYVSWFDAIANGFDVRLQRLDATGNEVWAHNGILVRDRGFSSTQDYGLAVDAFGFALVAYRDDSGTGTQISVSRVSPTGTIVYTETVTATTDFVAAPKVTGTSDGSAVVAWTQNADVRLQKLGGNGATLWGPTGVTLSPAGGGYSVSDLRAAGTGVILSFVLQTGGFGSPRNLLAQKFDGNGALLWGAGHVAVFDGGSLQFGNFPEMVADGSGGAVFAWYGVSPLQVRVQRVLANGTEAFAHDGLEASTDGTRVRVSPSASFDPTTSEITVAWVEQNALQSQAGLWAQRFDAAGARLWGSEGSELRPLSSDELGLVRALRLSTGSFLFWGESPGFGQDVLFGGRLDGTGAFSVGPFDLASTPSDKARLAGAVTSQDMAVLAWGDERVDAGDILAQNVNGDGTLGFVAAPVPLGPWSGVVTATLLLGLGARRLRRGFSAPPE